MSKLCKVKLDIVNDNKEEGWYGINEACVTRKTNKGCDRTYQITSPALKKSCRKNSQPPGSYDPWLQYP